MSPDWPRLLAIAAAIIVVIAVIWLAYTRYRKPSAWIATEGFCKRAQLDSLGAVIARQGWGGSFVMNLMFFITPAGESPKVYMQRYDFTRDGDEITISFQPAENQSDAPIIDDGTYNLEWTDKTLLISDDSKVYLQLVHDSELA